jgi:rubredoxin
MAEPKDMYQCQTANCGYIYNPDLPEDWKCPVCGAGKKAFKPLG